MIKKSFVIVIISLSLAVFQLFTSVFGNLTPLRQRSVHIMVILVLIILYNPIKIKNKIPALIFDGLFIICAIVPFSYMIVNYETLAMRMPWVQQLEPLQYFVAALSVVAVLECTRRVMGLALPIIAVAAIIYAFFGQHLPAVFRHSGFSPLEITDQIFYTTEGIFGIPLSASATFVILFIIFGSFLEQSGIGEYFMDLATKLTLKSRGGPAKMSIVSSCLFGSISGSAVANVVTTGQVTIPLMKKTGYNSEFAGAVEAVASTGGQIMPPIMGTAAFVMSDVTGIPYITIAKHALFPALLYYLSLYAMVHFQAIRKDIPMADVKDMASSKELLINSYLLLPIVIIVLLMIWGYSPTYACIYSLVSVLVISFIKKKTRMSLRKIIMALVNGVHNALGVAVACACAGILVGVVNYTGLGVKLSSFIISMASGYTFVLLLLTAITTILLGVGLPTTPAYIVVAALMVTTLKKAGISLLASNMFAYYFACISAITPPVAMASYAAAGLAKSEPLKTGFEAFKLGIVAYIVPFMFVYDETLLLVNDNILMLIWSLITATAGTCLLAASLQGWLLRSASILERILIGLAALAMIYPGIATDIVGLILGLAIILYQYVMKKKSVEKNRLFPA
jgi:TRAP transporter 4TM/12TM fusion protein